MADLPTKINLTIVTRERKIIEMRFFGGCTQAEIGKEIISEKDPF